MTAIQFKNAIGDSGHKNAVMGDKQQVCHVPQEVRFHP